MALLACSSVLNAGAGCECGDSGVGGDGNVVEVSEEEEEAREVASACWGRDAVVAFSSSVDSASHKAGGRKSAIPVQAWPRVSERIQTRSCAHANTYAYIQTRINTYASLHTHTHAHINTFGQIHGHTSCEHITQENIPPPRERTC